MIDDAIKPRCSKKMDAVSYHFDNCDSKSKPRHRSVTLGVVTERMFLPLDSEFKIGAKVEQRSDAQ